MTTARQIARAAAVVLAAVAWLLPPRATASMPRPDLRWAGLIPHTAPLASNFPADVLTSSEGAGMVFCRNDPVNNFDPFGLADEPGQIRFRSPTLTFLLPGHYSLVLSITENERQGYVDYASRIGPLKLKAAQGLDLAAVSTLAAPVALPIASDTVSSANVWAAVRIVQPVAQWLNRGGWVRAGIATLLGYEITPQGRQATCELAPRTYALGQMMPNGQIAGVGPGAMYSGELISGRAGSFAELNALRRIGDQLTPHHMPQAALEFTPYAEGGSVMLPQVEHVLTRTYGVRGAILAEEEAGLPFRTVLARDIVDLRRIAGAKYNAGIRALIEYYRQSFPELVSKPSP